MSREHAHECVSARHDTQRKAFQALEDLSIEELEVGVTQGVQLLHRLKKALIARKKEWTETDRWIENLETTLKKGSKPETVIGVMGSTGSGKSALLNALLDEEQLVPTNCMRACTAVITRIAFQDGEHPYRALIEFISIAEWERELRTLAADLIDENGKLSNKLEDEGAEAAIAYAKVKAVYPKKSKEDLVKCDIASMLEEVSGLLRNGTQEILETDPLRFSQQLQPFVDSKEKAAGIKTSDEKSGEQTRELWPLIRVVNLYVKASALSTGAVIVGLPGAQDSNAARAAIADRYMQKCTSLWIVAPINRAVDDRTANSLLGESFKRQLRMDNNHLAITLICSKTDDINYNETSRSLGMSEEMGELNLNIDALNAQLPQLQAQTDYQQTLKDQLEATIDDNVEQLEQLEQFRADMNPSDASSTNDLGLGSAKREGEDLEGPTSKRLRVNTEQTSADNTFSTSHPITTSEIDIKIKIANLKEGRKTSQAQKKEASLRLVELAQQRAQIISSIEALETQKTTKIISGRNQYLKTAMRKNFRFEMQEIHEELAEEESGSHFDSDSSAHEYANDAGSLPVFCVSARAYQKLQNRLKHEAPVPGFVNVDETEIPQLRAHCQILTETQRVSRGYSFRNSLAQFLNSLTLQIPSDHLDSTADAKEADRQRIGSSVNAFEKVLKIAVQNVNQSFESQVEEAIFAKLAEAVTAAADKAPEIVRRWGAPVNRNNRSAGGLAFPTYKAYILRKGAHRSAHDPSNWNDQLVQAMIKIIASGWESTFQHKLKTILNDFTEATTAALNQLRTEIQKQLPQHEFMLKRQIATYKKTFQEISSAVSLDVYDEQKRINRSFAPAIGEALKPAYVKCTDETGPGSFRRMKAIMSSHIEQKRNTMFKVSANAVKTDLEALLLDTQSQINDKTHDASKSLRRDCYATVGVHHDLISKPGAQTCEAILGILKDVDIVGLKGQIEGSTGYDGVDGVALGEKVAQSDNVDLASSRAQPADSTEDNNFDNVGSGSRSGETTEDDIVEDTNVDRMSVDRMSVDSM